MKKIMTLFLMCAFAVFFISCSNDFKEEFVSFDTTTRGSQKISPDGSEYFTVRKDKVIVKTNSEAKAKELCKQPVFISAHNISYVWIIATIDPQKTSMEDIMQMPNVIDATYGLEYSDGTVQYPTDIVYAKAKEGTSTEEAFNKAGLGKNIKAMYLSDPYIKGYNINLDVKLGDILKTCAKLSESGLLESAAPSFFREIRPFNPHHFDNWGLNNTGQYGATHGIDINTSEAWRITRGSPDIKIAVIDEGVDLVHPDLQANLLPGYDATIGAPGGANGSPYGDNAHGTACAGIIGAINNNIGIQGVAQNCKIVPVRIAYGLYGWWITYDGWIADGINYAWQIANADVLSNSWGGGSPSPQINDAIHNAVTLGRGGKGAIVVVSSGNENSSNVSYPASLSDVIAVGAISLDGQRKSPGAPDGELWGSNYGSALDIVAPGVLVSTTDISGSAGYNPNVPIHPRNGGNKIYNDYSDQNYTVWFNGTSAACPHVSGVAALILSVMPELTKSQVVDILESTASGYPTWNSQTGYGIVNAYQAVMKAIDMRDGGSIWLDAVPAGWNARPAGLFVQAITSTGNNTVGLLELLAMAGTNQFPIEVCRYSLNEMSDMEADYNNLVQQFPDLDLRKSYR